MGIRHGKEALAAGGPTPQRGNMGEVPRRGTFWCAEGRSVSRTRTQAKKFLQKKRKEKEAGEEREGDDDKDADAEDGDGDGDWDGDGGDQGDGPGAGEGAPGANRDEGMGVEVAGVDTCYRGARPSSYIFGYIKAGKFTYNIFKITCKNCVSFSPESALRRCWLPVQ